MKQSDALVPVEVVQQKILLIRNQKVMVDYDLAAFFGVETRELVKAVDRNAARFPDDFMFQLNLEETRALNALRSVGRMHGGRRKLPLVFTEQGVAMLSAVLRSERAILVSIQIVRSFIRLREIALSNLEFAARLRQLESRSDEHTRAIVQIIDEMRKSEDKTKRRIGFE